MPWAARAEDTELAKINKPIDVVFLSFVQPNAQFVKGSGSFNGTGLQFAVDFHVVKDAIKILRQKGIRVMLSVGGASYKFESGFNPKAIGDLVWDLNCDGVDLDWESDQGIRKAHEFGPIIQAMRGWLGWEKLVSCAVWSTGAFENTDPVGNPYRGMNVSSLQTHGKYLNFINVMAYDAGKSYDVIQAYEAYKKIYSGAINVGFEVGSQGWGDALLTTDDVDKVVNYVKNRSSNDGIFVWAYFKQGNPNSLQVIHQANSILSSTSLGKRNLSGNLMTTQVEPFTNPVNTAVAPVQDTYTTVPTTAPTAVAPQPQAQDTTGAALPELLTGNTQQTVTGGSLVVPPEVDLPGVSNGPPILLPPGTTLESGTTATPLPPYVTGTATTATQTTQIDSALIPPTAPEYNTVGTQTQPPYTTYDPTVAINPTNQPVNYNPTITSPSQTLYTPQVQTTGVPTPGVPTVPPTIVTGDATPYTTGQPLVPITVPTQVATPAPVPIPEVVNPTSGIALPPGILPPTVPIPVPTGTVPPEGPIPAPNVPIYVPARPHTFNGPCPRCGYTLTIS